MTTHALDLNWITCYKNAYDVAREMTRLRNLPGPLLNVGVICAGIDNYKELRGDFSVLEWELEMGDLYARLEAVETQVVRDFPKAGQITQVKKDRLVFLVPGVRGVVDIQDIATSILRALDTSPALRLTLGVAVSTNRDLGSGVKEAKEARRAAVAQGGGRAAGLDPVWATR